jgi:hypothetical protein
MKESFLINENTDFEIWEECGIISIPINELHKVFPECKKILPTIIKEDKKKLKKIKDLQEKIKQICIEKIKQPKNLDTVMDIAIATYGEVKKQEEIEHRIKTNTHILNNFIRTNHIKDISDIKRIPITNYIEINRGNKANCPLHNDKNASFTYYPQNNSFYCFGCGVGGDIIRFIEKLHNVDFKEALKILSK